MARTPDNDSTARSLVTGFILLLFFATPFAGLWSKGGHAWYLPYVLWLLVVVLLAVAHFRGRRKQDP